MNEQSTLGFVYDVEHYSPDGELLGHQHFHNLMPDEGIKWALAKVFVPNLPLPSWTKASYSYGGIINVYVSLFKGDFTPSKKDTMQTFPTMAEECKPSEIIYNPNYSSTRYSLEAQTTVYNKGLIQFKPVTIKIYEGPLRLTGLFVVAGSYPEVGKNTSALLLSEALFPAPINMEVNGTITLTCGCSLISG